MLVFASVAALATPADLTDLRVRAVPGQVFTYEMRVESSMPGGSFKARLFMEDRLLKQQGDIMFWKSDVQNVILETIGGFKEAEKSLRENLDFDAVWERDIRFRTVAIGIENFRMRAGKDEGTTDVVFPDKPVKPGAKWPGRFSIGGKTIPINYVFVGPGRIEGYPTHTIEARFSDPTIEQIKPYRFHVGQDDGRVVLSSGAAKVQTRGMTVEVSFTMRRTAKYMAPG